MHLRSLQRICTPRRGIWEPFLDEPSPLFQAQAWGSVSKIEADCLDMGKDTSHLGGVRVCVRFASSFNMVTDRSSHLSIRPLPAESCSGVPLT